MSIETCQTTYSRCSEQSKYSTTGIKANCVLIVVYKCSNMKNQDRGLRVFCGSTATNIDSTCPSSVKVDKPTGCECVILKRLDLGWSITKTSPRSFLCDCFSSTQYPFMACPRHFVYISLSSGSEAGQLQQGHGSWNQGDYWGVYLPKERGAVSDCPHHCPVSSQQGTQGALSSFMPCLASHTSLLCGWQLGSQQQCSLPPYL